jgi:hypothetical protein
MSTTWTRTNSHTIYSMIEVDKRWEGEQDT